jgi:hypothetical protein
MWSRRTSFEGSGFFITYKSSTEVEIFRRHETSGYRPVHVYVDE